MEFSVLGKLEVHRDGEPVALGSGRQRSLLALLLVHANSVVSTDRILDELWGDDVTIDRQSALWVHVSNLRSALEPDRARRSEGSVVLTQFPGYLARVAPDELDASRFETMVGEGRSRLASDPAAASIVLGEALALWRGRAYEDFLYDDFVQAEIARLEEMRMEAVELRLDADLERGLARVLVSELEGLVRAHPLRERLTGQLMVALHGSGRTSEALRAYRRLRNHLAEELGMDPSTELQRLEGRILTGDPTLLVGGGAPPAHPLAVRGYELREEITVGPLGPTYRAYQATVGREVAIRIVEGGLADDPEFIRRFETEAETVARLEHPHIVPVYDYWREPGAAFLVTRLFRGTTLAEQLRHGPLSPDRAVEVIRDVGSALRLSHARGVTHGAVGPATVLVDEDGHPYLTGFSIAGQTAWGPEPDGGEQPDGGTSDQLPGTRLDDVTALAELLAATLGPGAPPSLTDVVACAITDRRYQTVEQLLSAIDTAWTEPAESTDRASTTSGANPYKGLRPFGEVDTFDFHGRERIVERLVARLGGGGSRSRLMAVVGPSGSGKSSVVRAGLVPAVRSGAIPDSAGWFVTEATPGRQPFEALADALRRVAVAPPADLLDRLIDDEAGLRDVIDEVLPDDRTRLLLVIDQFEELFTQNSEDTVQAVADAISTAVAAPNGRLHVVLTLRADFYDRPLGHRRLGELVRRGTEVITPMSVDELARAIEAPAARAGVRFAPSLVAEIVREVADRAGALPLLQFALAELYERRRGDRIDRRVYLETGGVFGALVRRAELLYAELDEPSRELARHLLLRLVTVDDDDTKLTRVRIVRSTLHDVTDPAVDVVLDRFAEHRLLTFDRDPVTRAPTVEVAHEALFTEWDRLRSWIDESRDDIRQERRLRQRSDEWAAAGREDAYLARGPHLQQLLVWAATTDLRLDPIERDYLEASRDVAEHQERRERQRKEAETELRRTARRRARLLIGVAAVLTLVVGLASYAVIQRGNAERLAGDFSAVGDARRLAASSAAVAPEDPQLALLLALHSLDVSAAAGLPALPESEEALHWALHAERVAYPVTDAPTETRVGPGGLTGVFVLPFDDLVELARGEVGKPFTDAQCDRFDLEPCPGDDGLASPIAAGSRSLPAAPLTRPTFSGTDMPLAGTTVTIAGWGDPDAARLAAYEQFEAETGIRVSFRSRFGGDVESEIFANDPPDILEVGYAEVDSTARSAELLDLGIYVDEQEARQTWGDYLIDAARIDGELVGLPTALGIKGIVWYPVASFEAAGYEVPVTWAELLELSERIVADGGVPWCMGLDSGDVGGWPATDWVEGMVLRTGGTDLYDRWLDHDIPFDHPGIARAAATFGQIVFTPGFVGGDPASVSRRDIFEVFDSMFGDPPGCWLGYSADYFRELIPEDAVVGVDYDFFELPPLEQGEDPPVLGEAAVLASVVDRPEVREFMRYVMDPDGLPLAIAGTDEIVIPAHGAFDPEECATEQAHPRTNEARVRLCRMGVEAVSANRFRLDASDMMPPEIGLPAPLPDRGAFLEGMIGYTIEGPESLADVLAEIEAAWPE